MASLDFCLQPLTLLGALAPHSLVTTPYPWLSLCHEQYVPALPWQEWKAELKDLTKLLHRAEQSQEEEADTWDRDGAAAEAARKLQILYGHGAERRRYEDLLRVKPRGRIPNSRTITLKAEEVVSRFIFLFYTSYV